MTPSEDGKGFLVVCDECDYEEPMPFLEHAEHAKEVHETEWGHAPRIEGTPAED